MMLPDLIIHAIIATWLHVLGVGGACPPAVGPNNYTRGDCSGWYTPPHTPYLDCIQWISWTNEWCSADSIETVVIGEIREDVREIRRDLRKCLPSDVNAALREEEP